MSTYKLYHFGHSPRADLARLIFHYAGVDFEDNRLTKTEWPQYKSSNRQKSSTLNLLRQ